MSSYGCLRYNYGMRALLIPAVVIALALSPSISECISAHRDGQSHAWVLWAWVALVALLALVAGEELLGGGAA